MSRDAIKKTMSHIFLQVTKDPNLELEVRFHRRFTKKEQCKFQSSIQPTIFYEVIEHFRKGYIPNVYECEDSHTTDTLYDSQRLVEDHETGVCSLVWKNRETLPVFNSNVYVNPKGFKIALSKEIVSTDQEQCASFKGVIARLTQDVLKRRKDRTTFIQYMLDSHQNKVAIFRFDFTKVTKKRSGVSQEIFEIEMEYLGNKYSNHINYILERISKISDLFLDNLEALLRSIQNAHVLIKWDEFNSVIDDYKSLLQIPQHHTENTFRGTQPETLTRNTFQFVKQQAYYVADKSDGERALLFIDPRGDCYLISRYMQVVKLDCSLKKLSNSVFDTEWFEESRLCLIFDVLAMNSRDLRGETTTRRLGHISELRCLPFTHNGYRIEMKTIHFFSQMHYDPGVIREILENTTHEIDGIVFTPALESYPTRQKWPHLLKWKPPELNSIDLYVEQDPETNNWNTFARTLEVTDTRQGDKGWMLQENRDSMLICYQQNREEMVVNKEYLDVVRSVTVKIPFLPYPVVEYNKEWVEAGLIVDKRVIEFIWDIEKKKMQPIKVRQDKSVLGADGANFWTVAKETWKTMISPITKEDLLCTGQSADTSPADGDTSDTTNTLSTRRLGQTGRLVNDNLFKFHNVIKRRLISEYTTQTHNFSVHSIFKKMNGFYLQNEQEWSLPDTEEVTNWLAEKPDIEVRVNPETGRIHAKVTKSLTVSTSAFSLLDLCTGKGGDMWKWCQNGVSCVVALDNDPELLSGTSDSALSRWSVASKKHPHTKILFAEVDARTPVIQYLIYKNLHTDFDVVSCFFAMHYLFATKDTLHQFMVNVQQNLKFNGYFIGCIMDGKKVFEAIDKTGCIHVKTPDGNTVFKITKRYKSDLQPFSKLYPFGNEIDVQIGDSIISEYIDNIKDKKEYLVNFENFVKIAKHYDLDLVASDTFDNWFTTVRPDITDEQKQLSFMCRSFVFKKTSNSWMHQKNLLAEQNQIKKRIHDLQDQQLATERIEHFDLDTVLRGGVDPNFGKSLKKKKHPEPIVVKFDKKKYQEALDRMNHVKRQKVVYFTKDAWNAQVNKTKI